MTVLGVSVYPDIRPLEEIRTYLELAARYGFTRVFTSMFSVKGTNEQILAYFRDLNAVAHENGMKVSLDIEPHFMRRIGATPDDLSVFADINADILRMDGACSEDENVAMLNNPYGIQIEYNASALTPQVIESLVARGVDKTRMLSCHNFYPQRYSGFRWDRFCAVNERLSSLGIRVGAFMASHAYNTHGVWDATNGLPTVERLRDYPAELQARILAAAGTTDIFFGNAYASEDEFRAVREAITPVEPHYLNDQHKQDIKNIAMYVGEDVNIMRQRKVRVEPLYDITDVERKILFDYFPHLDMGDSSEWIWRSRGPRSYFKNESIPPRRHEAERFHAGDVVIVNDNYKHYAGEVQVVLRAMKDDGIRNLVGRISSDELTMFDVIADGDVVVFLPVR